MTNEESGTCERHGVDKRHLRKEQRRISRSWSLKEYLGSVRCQMYNGVRRPVLIVMDQATNVRSIEHFTSSEQRKYMYTEVDVAKQSRQTGSQKAGANDTNARQRGAALLAAHRVFRTH